jgi:hypothetical protein
VRSRAYRSIPPTGLTLGREGAGPGRLAFNADSDVSRRHCSIIYDPAGRFTTTDLGSSNGTYLLPDETRLMPNQAVECRRGQIIRVGTKNEFQFDLV